MKASLPLIKICTLQLVKLVEKFVVELVKRPNIIAVCLCTGN